MTHRNQVIATMLAEGRTRREIGEALGVSAPRISQLIGDNPELLAWRRGPSSLAERLYEHRCDLARLRRLTLELAHSIRSELRALDEELQSYEVDRVLGLR